MSPVILLVLFAGQAAASDARLESFERVVRPILASRCHSCHGPTKQKGELRLDHLSTILSGGESGPALVRGDPAGSRMVRAIRYEDPDLQMPPKGRLPEVEVDAIVEWIRGGAVWPDEPPPAAAPPKPVFDIDARRDTHWCWRPVANPEPPVVEDTSWILQPPDRFILAKLEEAGLKPAPRADPRALLRRLSFDLLGLPPRPEDVEAFAADPTPEALLAWADHFLESAQFGERWARHWLDLVRYGETLGHEFDYPIENAWRYRDYVIRAFNADVPYQQLVLEHIAGDRLDPPRTDPESGINESVIGTGFYWLGQQVHSPVDLRQNQADLLDNQIDVLSKTFLALTVACARCHDHKFDAISTRDFYSFFGIIESSRYAQLSIEPPGSAEAKARSILERKNALRVETSRLWARAIQERAGGEAWQKALEAPEAKDVRHPLAPWARLLRPGGPEGGEGFASELTSVVAELQAVERRRAEEGARHVVFADLRRREDAARWVPQDPAYTLASEDRGGFRQGAPDHPERPIERLLPRTFANGGGISRRLEGALRSPDFAIEKRFMHLRWSGREGRAIVIIDNFTLVRDPIYGSLRRFADNESSHWTTFDLDMWRGHHAYLELSDLGVPDPTESRASPLEGYVAPELVLFSDEGGPPANVEPPPALHLLDDERPRDRAAMTQLLVTRAVEAARAFGEGATLESDLGGARRALLQALLEKGLLDVTNAATSAATEAVAEGVAANIAEPVARSDGGPTSLDGGPSESLARVRTLLGELTALEGALAPATRVPGMVDGPGRDEHVFLRGSPRSPGEPVPRRFLRALEGSEAPFATAGSGRLELARRIADPSNPFLGRVIVNRVWHHLFGVGLVPSVDNFGVLGEAPSHPELLDWLSRWFLEDGRGSMKALVRLLVTSNAYAMSSRLAAPSVESADPGNRLLHRAQLRRLEGEALRDAVLWISGRLDSKMFGPPVPVHLTPFMTGRGRPGSSGPLDGDGRRSIYQEVRRNFLPPLFTAFDTPLPASTIGRRSHSNVPAQALILLNDPFLREQAERLGRRLAEDSARGVGEKIGELYWRALGRPVEEEEVQAAKELLGYLAPASAASGGGAGTGGSAAAPPEAAAWAELCHSVLNLKELIYLR